MGKRATTKRAASTPDAAERTIDAKARKRIEELYELTDEIINAYNEVNETYVNKIYRKYKQLQNENKRLKLQLYRHHCQGCKCPGSSTNDAQLEEDEEEVEDQESDNASSYEESQSTRRKSKRIASTATPSTVTTRSKKNNPFIISDVEDTQNFDGNDSRINGNDTDDAVSMNTNANETTTDGNQSEADDEDDDDEVDKNIDEYGEEVEEDEGMVRLPITLRDIIRRKAEKNKNAKAYLLQTPRYPALCEYLRDRNPKLFDHRPTELQVRPLIENHIGAQAVKDAKVRMRLRDELREIHRSYLRTVMTDPHGNNSKISIHKVKRLNIKKSPM